MWIPVLKGHTGRWGKKFAIIAVSLKELFEIHLCSLHAKRRAWVRSTKPCLLSYLHTPHPWEKWVCLSPRFQYQKEALRCCYYNYINTSWKLVWTCNVQRHITTYSIIRGQGGKLQQKVNCIFQRLYLESHSEGCDVAEVETFKLHTLKSGLENAWGP